MIALFASVSYYFFFMNDNKLEASWNKSWHFSIYTSVHLITLQPTIIWLNNSFAHWQKILPVKEFKRQKKKPNWKLHCIFNTDKRYVLKITSSKITLKIWDKK